MKIPESSANVGAYYANEENGQWQPNGVIIDSGVGGGVVGSGDAGIHRPPVYPVHIPRGHIPGYVMAGAYYPPPFGPVPPPQDEFADYMWMENEEEFDKQVMQQLEEEALMEQCIEAMLEDEQRERHHRPTANGHSHYPTTSNGSLSLAETVSRSTLNPLAAEFVPTKARPHTTTEEKPETTEPPSEESQKTKEEVPETQIETKQQPETTEETNTEKPTPPTDPPEVSAADIQPIDKTDKRKDKKEVKKTEIKKPIKQEIKVKAKPQIVKSETKVQQKKREVKLVKSEVRDEKVESEIVVPLVETAKTAPAPLGEETPSIPSGPKPINYAAAAKANKPKKPPSPPMEPAKQTIQSKIERKVDKKDAKVKTEKVVQRKNSTK